MTWVWTLVRFAHVCGAVLWVGGQLALSLVVLPLARRTLPVRTTAEFASAAGRRFGILTAAVFLPVQLVTGFALAGHEGVTLAGLTGTAYGRTLTAKLLLFALVMVAAAAHGWAYRAGRTTLARALALGSLAGSLGIVLLATALAEI